MSAKKAAPPDFRKNLESIAAKGHDNRKVFDAFTRFAACALACLTRETEYLEEAKRWKPDELSLYAEAFAALIPEMEAKPFEDVLGPVYMDWALSRSGAQRGGEFHTPRELCRLIAKMTWGDGSHLPSSGPITVAEPCSGAGAMILALGEHVSPEVRRRLRVTAIDLNPTACDMTFINTTLWGIPTRVYHGDALWLEKKCHGAWSNIHYICPWLPLAMRVETPEAGSQGKPPSPKETEAVARAVKAGQSAFEFFDVAADARKTA